MLLWDCVKFPASCHMDQKERLLLCQNQFSATFTCAISDPENVGAISPRAW